jgi:hypothetical protein
MEALVLLLVALSIWRWFAWRKRFATLTSATEDLHKSISALRGRVAELERHLVAPPVTAEPRGLAKAVEVVSDRTPAAEVEKGGLARAIREAALRTAEEHAETPAEAQPFIVLELKEEAPPVAPGAVVGQAVEVPSVRPEPVGMTLPPVPPPPPPAPVAAAAPVEAAHPAVELLRPPPTPAAQPTGARAEAIRDRVARLRERQAAAASVPAAAEVASGPPPADVRAEPPQRSARWERISAADRTAPHAHRAWQWAAMFRRKAGETPDWEALIGGSWLNVIGIVVFVLGMALLAQYSLSRFPAAGKIATGLVIGFVLMGCGVRLERVQRYRLLAWTLVGGGWALLYFTAYAAYNIEASRIIAEPALGLLVLSIVAAGIIVHSLKYRSELVTGLAYGLGFLAVTVTPLNAYTLAASALLAASQIAILRFFTWHYLALIAVAGTYLNHARWLGETVGVRPDFWLSQGILAFYWALFVLMGLVRRPMSGRESLIHLTVNVANTIGLLGLSAWQIWVLHGENLHALTASAMLAYVVAAGVSRISDRADLLRFNGSVAVLLFALTLPLASEPLGISGHWLAIYWVVGGVLAVVCGYRAREYLLRLEGYALCGLGCLAVFTINLESALPFADWRLPYWWVAPSVIVALLGLSEFLLRIAGSDRVRPGADRLGQGCGYAATAILAAFLWKVADPELLGPSWLVAGLAFFEAGAGWRRPLLRNQGYVLLALAFAALLAVNLAEIQPPSAGLAGAGLLPRPVIVGIAAAIYGYVFWRLRRERCGIVTTAIDAGVADLFSVAATTVVAALAWTELDSSLVGLAWIFLGLALFEVGAGWPRPVLRGQAYVLFGLAFAALLGINLYGLHSSSTGLAGAGLLPRAVTVGVSAAAYYYLYGRLRGDRPGFGRMSIEPLLGDLFSIAGSALVAILAWKELDSGLVALTWIAAGLVLFEAGARWPRPLLRYQGYVLFGLAFASLMAINLLQAYPGAVGLAGAGVLPRAAVVGLAAAVYYVLFWRLRREVCGFAPTEFEPGVADLLAISATLLVAVLAWKELDPAHVALGWAFCGLVLFEVGARWPRPLLRNQGYVLFAFAFAALLIVNLYEIAPAQGSGSPLPRWLQVGPAALAAYWVFWRLQPDRRGFDANANDDIVADFVSIAGTVLLTVLAWKELDSVTVALAWGFLALGLFEIGKATQLAQLTRQAHVLAALSFARLFMANFIALGQSMGISHRLLSVLPITALLYYLYVETLAAPRLKLFGRELDLPRLYVWAAGIALVALARFELGRAYAVVGMAPLFVAFVLVGRRFAIVDFRAQAYLVAVLTFARCWATNAYLVGAAFGMPERLVTMVPVIVAFAVTTAICLRPSGISYGSGGNVLRRSLSFADANPQHVFAFLGAALTAILFYYELPIGWVTLALAIEALILILSGIATEQRSFRLYGLTLLLIALLKLVVIDVRDVEPIYRILSYIGLGLILLLASLLYTRYRSVVERYV